MPSTTSIHAWNPVDWRTARPEPSQLNEPEEPEQQEEPYPEEDEREEERPEEARQSHPFQEGDTVQVISDSSYGITKRGSLGKVTRVGRFRIYVKFYFIQNYTGGHGWDFDINPNDLELYQPLPEGICPYLPTRILVVIRKIHTRQHFYKTHAKKLPSWNVS